MGINEKQIELARLVPTIVGLLPAERQTLVSSTGKDVAMIIAKSGLTIREQQAALAVTELFLQFCHNDPVNKKLDDIREDMIRRQQ